MIATDNETYGHTKLVAHVGINQAATQAWYTVQIIEAGRQTVHESATISLPRGALKR